MFQLETGSVANIHIRIPTDNLIYGIIELSFDGLQLSFRSTALNPFDENDVDAIEFFDMNTSTLLLADDFLSKTSKKELDKLLDSLVVQSPDVEETISSDQSSISQLEAKGSTELGVIASWIGKLFERLRINFTNSKVSLLFQREKSLNILFHSMKYADLKIPGVEVFSQNLQNIRSTSNFSIDTLNEKLIIIDGVSMEYNESLLFESAPKQLQEILVRTIPDFPFEIFTDMKDFNLYFDKTNGDLFKSLYQEYISPLSSSLQETANLENSSYDRPFLPGPIPTTKALPKFSFSQVQNNMMESLGQSIVDPLRSPNNPSYCENSSDIFYSVIDHHSVHNIRTPLEEKFLPKLLNLAEVAVCEWNIFLDFINIHLMGFPTLKCQGFKYSIKDSSWKFDHISMVKFGSCFLSGNALKKIHIFSLNVQMDYNELSILQNSTFANFLNAESQTRITPRISGYFARLESFLNGIEISFDTIAVNFSDFVFQLDNVLFINGTDFSCRQLNISSSQKSLIVIELLELIFIS